MFWGFRDLCCFSFFPSSFLFFRERGLWWFLINLLRGRGWRVFGFFVLLLSCYLQFPAIFHMMAVETFTCRFAMFAFEYRWNIRVEFHFINGKCFRTFLICPCFQLLELHVILYYEFCVGPTSKNRPTIFGWPCLLHNWVDVFRARQLNSIQDCSSGMNCGRFLNWRDTSRGNAFGFRSLGPQAFKCLFLTLMPVILSFSILCFISIGPRIRMAFLPSVLFTDVLRIVILSVWLAGSALRILVTVSLNNLSCSSRFWKISPVNGRTNSILEYLFSFCVTDWAIFCANERVVTFEGSIVPWINISDVDSLASLPVSVIFCRC